MKVNLATVESEIPVRGYYFVVGIKIISNFETPFNIFYVSNIYFDPELGCKVLDEGFSVLEFNVFAGPFGQDFRQVLGVSLFPF